ncbi:MAG: histidine--tRNA ligase [Chitinophagaceae bacterium]
MKPSIPQGTRDFDSLTIYKRQYIINTIKKIFLRYGFEPLETPAMENLETLMGKYGQEGDKLIFKILNNGLHESKKKKDLLESFEQILEQSVSLPLLTERALRYDLTIPLARFVAKNKGTLTFPYKRYQIQPVWRADRPQHGRYREFYQCDADIIGTSTLINEVELLCIYKEVFQILNIPVSICINHRQILKALNIACGLMETDTQLIIWIDKLDKIGEENFYLGLQQEKLNFTTSTIDLVKNYLHLQGNVVEKISQLKNLFRSSVLIENCTEDLSYIFSHLPKSYIEHIILDLTLARGLDYYTGCIFEIKAQGLSIGSLGGGGRYDNLTSLFGIPQIKGVGISFGIDRIYDVIESMQRFPNNIVMTIQVLFFNMGTKESAFSFQKMQILREKNIRCELYHKMEKLEKQFKYAQKKLIPYIIIIGEKEIQENRFIIKDINTGKQENLSWEEILKFNF